MGIKANGFYDTEERKGMNDFRQTIMDLHVFSVMLDRRADAATDDQYSNGSYYDWRHQAHVLRMAANIMQRETTPPAQGGAE